MIRTETIKQRQAILDWMKNLDEKGRFTYEIKGFIPNGNFAIYKGNNYKGKIYTQFALELDALINRDDVIRIQVCAGNGRTPLGTMEIVSVGILQAPTLFPFSMPQQAVPAQKGKTTAEQPMPEQNYQAQQQCVPQNRSQMWELFGLSVLGENGLAGIAEQVGDAGVFVKLKEKQMREQFDKELMQKESTELTRQNGILEQKITGLEAEKTKLEREIDKLKDKNADLEDEIDRLETKLEKNNKQAAMLQFGANLLGGMAKNSKVGAAVNTMLNGIIGLEDDDDEQPMPPMPQPQYQPAPQPVGAGMQSAIRTVQPEQVEDIKIENEETE